MAERLTDAIRAVVTAPPRRVTRLLRSRGRVLLLIVPLALLEAALDGALTLSYRFLIDRAIEPADRRALIFILAVLGATVVAAGGLAILRDRLYVRWAARAVSRVRTAIFEAAQHLPVSYHANHSASDVLGRLSGDVAWLDAWLVTAVNTLLLPALSVLVGAGLLVYLLPWELALAAMLVWPLALIGPRVIAPKAGAAVYDQKAREAAALLVAEEALAAQRVVKAYDLAGPVGQRFAGALGLLEGASVRAGTLAALVERSTVIGVYTVQIAAVAVASWLAYSRQITLGAFIAFVTVFWSLGWSLVVLARSAPGLVAAAASVRRIDELLAEPPEEPDRAGAIPAPPLARELALDAVTFAYGDRGPVLRGVSLSVPRGAYVAIVGPSGSGKSSVLNLLARFYDPDDGRVLLDGTDVRGYTRASVRAQLGFVFQDSVLFSASVRENIRAGWPAATDADVEAAARAAEIHDTIVRLPNGYDTLVSGGTLSGGQRQRIAIARALVRNPGVLVLDEATAALDPVTERAINETLFRAGRGRTTIAVTHRLAGVVRADHLVVVAGGEVAERGTHDELLARNGVYADMWRRQQGIAVSGDGGSAEVAPQRLSVSPMLAPLSQELGTLASRFVGQRAAAGDVVVRQGEPGDRFYLIVRGTASVTRAGADGVAVEIGRLSDGDEFGEAALLFDAPRNATVTARTDCLFLTLSRADFLALLDRVPEARAHVESIARARNAPSTTAGPASRSA